MPRSVFLVLQTLTGSALLRSVLLGVVVTEVPPDHSGDGLQVRAWWSFHMETRTTGRAGLPLSVFWRPLHSDCVCVAGFIVGLMDTFRRVFLGLLIVTIFLSTCVLKS